MDMRKKKRCYLCGGKLTNGYCPDCGLDNTRIERVHYHLNESHAVESINGMEENPLKRCRSMQSKKQKERLYEEAAEKVSGYKGTFAQTRKDTSAQTREDTAARQNYQVFQAVKGAGATAQQAFQAMKGAGTTAQQKYRAFQAVKGAAKSSGHARRKVRKVGSIVVVVVLLIRIVMMAYDSYREEHASSFTPWEGFYDSYEPAEAYDPYEYVERELSETGNTFVCTVEPGEYIVGVHLPEGAYTINLVEGSGSVSIDDFENSIYLWNSFGTDEEYDEIQTWEDVRLYEGASVSVHNGVLLEFATENARMEEMEAERMQNPLTESVRLEKGKTYTVGKDFPEGVYDAQIESGWSSVEYQVPTDDEYAEDGMDHYYIWLEDEGTDGVYRNVVLTEGVKITSEDADIMLVPSEVIGKMDYSTYYK